MESIAQQHSLHQHSLNDQEGSRDITQEGRKLRPNAVQRPLDPPPPYLHFRDQPGKAGDHSRRTPRIILLASRVIHQLHTGAWGNSQFQAQVRCSISEYIPNCERQETSKRTGVTLHQVPEVEIFSFSILLRSPHFARQMQ